MLRTCAACGKTNRIPAGRLADSGHCGDCRAELPPLAEPLEVGRDQFKEIINAVKVPVLVDFWAEWCGPCRMAAPQVKMVAQNVAGKAVVLKVNTDENPELAQLFHIRGIPTFAVIKNGDLVHQQPGLVGHEQLERWLADAAV